MFGIRVTLFVDDPDFRLYVGDVREQLSELEPGSVDCVITSPPYWGLRDYGTGQWDGGDLECDHLAAPGGGTKASGLANYENGLNQETIDAKVEQRRQQFRQTCGKCGATRRDNQIGLEATPEAYVAQMVEVFRGMWRVLADHGTCWVNLGDSYNSNESGGMTGSRLTKMGKQSPANRIGKPRANLKPKDLVGVPWRVAFALQADGWYLRSDIIWSKPNPMPESVTDRPTKSHEYVFLLSKRPRYFFDAEAVREPHSPDGRKVTTRTVGNRSHDNYQEFGHEEGRERWPNGGRNVRSVWEITTHSYPEAHFATYPEQLVRRCLLAGCPVRVCRVCGKPSERLTERVPTGFDGSTYGERAVAATGGAVTGGTAASTLGSGGGKLTADYKTTGWSDCGHNNWRPGTVLDPFMGSGTTALVARKHGRHAVGVELSPVYAELCARRLSQLSLLAELA